MERGKVRPDTATPQGVATGSVPSGSNRKGLSTVAGRAGGPARRSGEAPAMGGERRGRVICGCVRSVNRARPGRSCVDELKAPSKPFDISKWEGGEAYRQGGAKPGGHGGGGGRWGSEKPGGSRLTFRSGRCGKPIGR